MTDLKIPHSHDLQAVRSALVADVLRRDVFPPGGKRTVRLRVRGESMLPSLWPGDTAEIEACSSDQLRVGDIVLAARDGRLIVHRLVSRDFPSGFVLCGDHKAGPDELFPPEALLGRMVSRKGRPIPTSVFRARATAKLFRAAGLVLCHWSFARRAALVIHRRLNPSRQPMQAFHSTTELSTP
jgi:Predicted transcriptional regulator